MWIDLVLFVAPGLLIWAWWSAVKYIWRRWIDYPLDGIGEPLSYSWRVWQKYW